MGLRQSARFRRSVALVGGVAVAVSSGAAFSTSAAAAGDTTGTGRLVFSAEAASFVYADEPDRQAPDTKLVASSVEGQAKVSYLRFAVRGIPAGKSVTAHLMLTRTDHHLPQTVRVSTADSTWSEESLTGRTAPAIGGVVTDVQTEFAAGVLSVDVSSVVSGDETVTFALSEPEPNATAVFYSRLDDADAPSLVVDYGGTATDPQQPDIPTPTPTPSPGCTVSELLVPSCGTWWGAGATPLGTESYDEALQNFEATQGRAADVLHYYHVGDGLFPSAREISRSHEGGMTRLLMENWKPELGHSWAQVAAGVPNVDAEIDNEAAYLKAHFTTKFFLAIHHEPENEVISAPGSGMTASDFAAMYRHVALRLRADGVTNAVYVMNYMGFFRWGEQPWFSGLYPGNDVVDWIAYDPYSNGSGDFGSLVDARDGSKWPGFYTWATTTHPGKPLMLAEWGVTERANNPGAKANFFDAMPAIERGYPAIKAILYWNSDGYPTRVDSTSRSLAAFQELAQDPLYDTHLSG
jgi:hypothetical protein